MTTGGSRLRFSLPLPSWPFSSSYASQPPKRDAPPAGRTGAGSASSSAAARAARKAKQRTLDPADFMVSKRSEEVVVKEQGAIDGEQLNIEECVNCDIFLLDHIAQVFVDECVGCRIFVGPTESAVFIRNCTDCSMVIACQQFRSRDCSDCRLALFCTTEPIIETSTGMQFACFDFFYFSLREQIAKAGLKLWNNKWWQVHDFNKNSDNPNWGLLPQEDVPTLLNARECSALSDEEIHMDRVVPVTLGSRPRPSEESCLALFLPGADLTYVEALLALVGSREAGWWVCRARSTFLPDENCQKLFHGWMKDKEVKKVVAACRGRELIGVEVCGEGVRQGIRDAMTPGGPLATLSQYVRLAPEENMAMLAKAFFEVWKDQI